jgi:hypothetical protein
MLQEQHAIDVLQQRLARLCRDEKQDAVQGRLTRGRLYRRCPRLCIWLQLNTSPQMVPSAPGELIVRVIRDKTDASLR